MRQFHRHRPSLLLLLIVVAMATLACTDLSLPENALVSCESDADCPASTVCRTQLSRCVDPSLLDQPVIAFEQGVTLSRDVVSRVPPYDVVEVTFALNRRPKSVSLLVDEDVVGSCEVEGLSVACGFSLSELPEAGEGVHGVTAIVEDELANRARDEAAVRFDFTAPDIPPDTVWLRRRAAPTSAIQDVSAVGSGGAAELQFVVSETLGPIALVSARLGTASVEMTRDEANSIGLLELHRLEVDEALDDGEYLLEASLEDPVGNAATVTFDVILDVDTTPPVAPANAPDELVLHRAPWGSFDSGGAPSFRVSGAAGVVEAAALVVVSSSEDALGVEHGRARAADDGSFEVPLIPQDLSRMYVHAIDGAGNRGPASLVRGVVWRATLGRKVAGESFANPHTMWSTGRLSDVLRPPGSVEVANAAGTGGSLTGVAATTTAAWRKVPLDGQLHPIVMDHAVVFDKEQGRALLFGGAAPPYQAPTQLMWERENERWRELPVEGALPPARRDHAMVWDADQRRAVLFGGNFGGTFSVLGDTWVFEGGRWRQLDDEAGPPARAGHALAWDSTRGVVVLFGGSDNTATALNDTWELHGDTWVPATPTDSPPARVWHAMAFDDVAGDVVLFGGGPDVNDTEALAFGDMWVYDGVTWSERTASVFPPARVDHVLVADEERGVLVLAGGRPTLCYVGGFEEACNTSRLDDTWEWDGVRWRPVDAVLGEPIGDKGTSMHAAFHDAIAKRVFVSGGWHGGLDIAGAVPEARLYELTPRGWMRRLEADGYFRERFAFTYDAARDRFVAHGGGGEAGAAFGYANDVYEFDGETWSQILFGSPPEGREHHALAYVPGVGSVMSALLGSDEPDWAWTGDAWTPLLSNTLPPRRAREVLVWDDERDELVLFGGRDETGRSSETWTRADSIWAQGTPANVPPARDYHAMAFDDARDVVVLFGGQTDDGALGDTWEWDGADWRDATPANGPSVRSAMGLAYDPVGKRVILFGGQGSDGLLDDSWAWDGQAWHPLPSPTTPAPRAAFGMGWDLVEKRLALHGGSDTTQVTASDHWVMEPGHEARAAILARFVFDASGAPADVLPTAARVRSVAGGVSTLVDDAGVATAAPGVSLRVFSGGRWRELASEAHSSSAPALLEASATDIARWFGGEGRALHVAVTMAEPGGVTASDGTQPGVVVQHLELELEYVLP